MLRIFIASVVTLALTTPLMATSEEALDSFHEEAFAVTEEITPAQEIMRKATAAQSVFQVAQATNTNTTGHGNVKFRVTYDSNLDRWDLLIW